MSAPTYTLRPCVLLCCDDQGRQFGRAAIRVPDPDHPVPYSVSIDIELLPDGGHRLYAPYNTQEARAEELAKSLLYPFKTCVPAEQYAELFALFHELGVIAAIEREVAHTRFRAGGGEHKEDLMTLPTALDGKEYMSFKLTAEICIPWDRHDTLGNIQARHERAEQLLRDRCESILARMAS